MGGFRNVPFSILAERCGTPLLLHKAGREKKNYFTLGMICAISDVFVLFGNPAYLFVNISCFTCLRKMNFAAIFVALI